MLRLVIEDDEGKTTVVPLIRDEITIGRKEGNTIRLTERNVSRRHARLLRSDGASGTVQVEDLESYNGVRLNGARISDRATVRPGDLLQIGDYSLAVKSDRPADAEEGVTPPAATQIHPLEAEHLPESERGKLVVVSSNLAGETFPLDRREVIVGRTDENDVVLNHRSISRNHAKLIIRDGSFSIIDLASSNGVKVNGESFGTSALLNGDIIELGHVKLRFVGPGDDYVFSRADIDDVEIDGGLPLGKLLFFLVLLLAAAAVTYFVVQPRSEPAPAAVPPGASGERPAGDAPATAPPQTPPPPRSPPSSRRAAVTWSVGHGRPPRPSSSASSTTSPITTRPASSSSTPPPSSPTSAPTMRSRPTSTTSSSATPSSSWQTSPRAASTPSSWSGCAPPSSRPTPTRSWSAAAASPSASAASTTHERSSIGCAASPSRRRRPAPWRPSSRLRRPRPRPRPRRRPPPASAAPAPRPSRSSPPPRPPSWPTPARPAPRRSPRTPSAS